MDRFGYTDQHPTRLSAALVQHRFGKETRARLAEELGDWRTHESVIAMIDDL